MDRDRMICVEHGAPWIISEFPTYPKSNWLGIANRFWEQVHLFSETKEYAFRLRIDRRLSRLQIVLAHTFYNPTEPIDGQWIEVGPYDRRRILALVRAGLEHDDDIIQQWFEAHEVMELLEASTSYDELVTAVDAVCAGLEASPETIAYIERILGPRSEP